MFADGSRIPLTGVFPDEVGRFFERAGAFAAAQGTPLAIVGGPVRDWLLGIGLHDFDFVVEGDALELVRRLLSRWQETFPDLEQPSPAHGFPRFGTTKISLKRPLSGIEELDFASARKELYPRPGRAPEVTYPVSLREDLGRRDFSINALALRFAGPGEAELLDPFSGVDDISARRLRVLHGASFVDDPARIIRALRFRQRFGLSVEPKTEALLREGIDKHALSTLTPQRRFDELRKALDEPDIENVIAVLSEAGILGQVHPAMSLSREALRKAALRPAGDERRAAALGPMLAALSDAEYEAVLKEWGLSRKTAAYFVKVRGDVA